ncbi:uncharacterized protein PGTG_14902 [Puccinia graminis f. sp. tritici CRL 75-36-700-3]|uniref:Tc1-like transposase DDE domain-containing protein n=1 Tax=Puccinia graminis f. sp. tritici (strain CRL 75-36-700-3 / race SCCL) TaxID=418459 RepID=E3KXX5_PUCGT|nr:uncharacterized protein PGTG_14902 [Puccinia graminis f. sp. tritici CRL 75-36-700-3]EFP89061.1 hypothetical protein PGTG_14902 [Puccinia graminis f. sp. tritici CRL 75-36-700-3]
MLQPPARVWAQAPVPRVLAPRGPGPAPRGPDLAGRAGVGPWHWPKSGLAAPKLWAHQITKVQHRLPPPPSMSKSAVMDPTDLEIQANKERSREAIKKAKANVDETRTYKNDRLTHKERKPNAIIKPEVRDLIRKNVNGKGMKIGDAIKKFNVSRRQIQRIKGEDPNLIRTHKKRPGKFTDDMKTKLLMQLDQKSTTTLVKMVAFIKDRFDVKVSTQAISNLIHDMDISWKQVTNIHAAWNKPNLIEQRANFVNRRGLDLGQRVVFVDEAGFDLHSSRASGYAPSGQPAVLSLVPKAKQITLIGALLVEGFDYYELLNADNTKAKGVGADEFCLFLGSLGARLPKEAIIIIGGHHITRRLQIDQGGIFTTLLSVSQSDRIQLPFDQIICLIKGATQPNGVSRRN